MSTRLNVFDTHCLQSAITKNYVQFSFCDGAKDTYEIDLQRLYFISFRARSVIFEDEDVISAVAKKLRHAHLFSTTNKNVRNAKS